MLVIERGGNNALTDFCDAFGNRSNALLILWGKKKRAQEGAMDAVAKSKLGLPHPLEQILGKPRRSQECRLQYLVPFLLRGRRRHGEFCSARHFADVPGCPAGRAEVAGAA